MKKVLVIILAVLITSCSTSQPQIEPTSQATAFQTKAAVPTVDPTLTEISTFAPFTMPPTWTPQVSSNDLSSHVCHINGAFPDSNCTPGAVFPVTATQVCKSGYSQSVRSVSESTKDQVYASYGIINHLSGQYEIDHFIPLELGGSNEITNLWPEAAQPNPGFHEKDKVENFLHDQVCSEAISLQLSQNIIKEDWVKVYDALASAQAPTLQTNLEPTLVSIPTLQIVNPPPTSPPSRACCKVCTTGKPCGDSCISKSYTCHKAPGCAC